MATEVHSPRIEPWDPLSHVPPSPGLQGFIGEEDYEALVKCVHCGLCLNECPTYRANGLEPDSPRGRLYLIRAVSEGTLPLTDEVEHHLDQCLVCRACETACPSNVQFGQVMEAARHAILEEHASLRQRVVTRIAFRHIFPHPARLELIGRLVRWYQQSPFPAIVQRAASLGLFPKRLALMERMAPRLNDTFFESPPSEVVSATASRRFTVGMVSGCIMPLAFAPTNDATVRVLAANGCDVVIPHAQRCCGALAAHAGDESSAASMARANIDAFESFGIDKLDAIVINSAGCGAQIKSYDHVLRHDPAYAARARRFVSKVEDIAEFLARVGLTAQLGRVDRTITYQDACHLVHGQRIRSQPRELLNQVPGVKLIEMRDSARCCGSAGIYNILQPDTSAKVLEAKIEHVSATGADCVVASNPGCLLQINMGLRDRGLDLEGKHLVDILDEAIVAGNRRHFDPKRDT